MKNTPELTEQLLKNFKDYLESTPELCEDNINMMKFLPKLLKLQNDKGMVYGSSYARHGDLSVFMNAERKWDRISNIMDRAMQDGLNSLYGDQSSTPTETLVDTIVDLASYGCLWAVYIMQNHPKEFEKFLNFNKL